MLRSRALLLLAATLVSIGLGTAWAQQQPAGPTDAEVQRARGYFAWKRAVWTAPNELVGVTRHLDRAMRSATEFDPTVGFLLAYCRLRLGDTGGARELLARTRKAVPDFAGYDLITGVDAQEAQRPAEALTAFDRLLADRVRLRAHPLLGPELEFLGLLFRGQALVDAGRNQAAIESLEEAIHISRKRGKGKSKSASSARILLARANVQLDQYGIAESLLLEVLADDPSDPLHYFQVGLVHADQQDLETASFWYGQAVLRDPAFARPYVKLAYIAGESGDLAGMRSHLETYAALSEAEAKASAAAAGLPIGQARPPAEVVADVATGLGKYWHLVGDARDGRREDADALAAWRRAVEHYRRALSARPDCLHALNGLVRLLARIPDSKASEIEEYSRQLKRARERGFSGGQRTTFC